MSYYDSSLDRLLREAADHLNAGRKDEAREILGKALGIDRNNLTTWELLWRAAYTVEEELSSVKHILKIDPKHTAAKKRFAELQRSGVKQSISQPLSRSSSRRPANRGNRQEASLLLLLLGGLLLVVCVGVTGIALFRGGYVPFLFSSNLTATAISEKNAACQALIDRTIQASHNYCNNTSSNTTCYGNTKLHADVAPDTTQRFSEPGDTLPVNKLLRLSASPLNLASSEWGIAVFKVVANLPRSLPGETVTMIVFGNATLDNKSVGSNSLESFYFTSELGQIVCEKIPFDGLMISTPNGSGIRFTVNGAELTLMGNASIKAIKNGQMEVTVYKGSARIVANGQEQYFGAGQKSSVQLGGANGNESVSPPSAPESLTGDGLTMACTLTGEYCSSSEVTPVSVTQAESQIQSEITATPTLVYTPTITRTPSPTDPPTYTAVVFPSRTPTKTQTLTPTITKTPTKTPIPPTNTPTNTLIPSRTFTPSNTPTPSFTFTPSNTPTKTSTPTSTFTFTPTPVSPLQPICPIGPPGVSASPLNLNQNKISMDITNNNGSSITINRFFAYWVKSPNSQKVTRLLLNNAVIWNTSDPTSPSDFPTESNWANGAADPNLIIPNATTETLQIQFQDDLQSTGYQVHVVFDIGCQVSGSQ